MVEYSDISSESALEDGEIEDEIMLTMSDRETTFQVSKRNDLSLMAGIGSTDRILDDDMDLDEASRNDWEMLRLDFVMSPGQVRKIILGSPIISAISPAAGDNVLHASKPDSVVPSAVLSPMVETKDSENDGKEKSEKRHHKGMKSKKSEKKENRRKSISRISDRDHRKGHRHSKRDGPQRSTRRSHHSRSRGPRESSTGSYYRTSRTIHSRSPSISAKSTGTNICKVDFNDDPSLSAALAIDKCVDITMAHNIDVLYDNAMFTIPILPPPPPPRDVSDEAATFAANLSNAIVPKNLTQLPMPPGFNMDELDSSSPSPSYCTSPVPTRKSLAEPKTQRLGDWAFGTPPNFRILRPIILNRRNSGSALLRDWGERCVDVFQIISQIGEGTYGQVSYAHTQ